MLGLWEPQGLAWISLDLGVDTLCVWVFLPAVYLQDFHGTRPLSCDVCVCVCVRAHTSVCLPL